MAITFSERQIQDQIWKTGRNISSLITDPVDFPLIDYGKDLENLTPESILSNILNTRLSNAYNKLETVFLIGKEVALSKELESTIRADFIGITEGTNSICIVELKKSNKTERESFTELLAYTNHFIDILPTLTKNDILLCLITPMENRIVKEAYLNSLLFDKKPIVLLTPYFPDGTLESLRLKLWIPTKEDVFGLSKTSFLQKNFSVFKITWQDIPNYWNPETGDSSSYDMIKQMDDLSTIAAQIMEERGIHGFVYCSQLWPELKDKLPNTNAIILVGFNPFAIAGNKLDVDKHVPYGLDEYRLSMSHKLSELIPSLTKYEEDDEKNDIIVNDRFEFLYSCWNENLIRIGFEAVKFAMINYQNVKPDLDWGSFTWKSYQENIVEHVTCNNYALRTTGLIREMYFETIRADYNFSPENHPVLGDYYPYAINYSTSHELFFTFLNRMLYESGSELIE